MNHMGMLARQSRYGNGIDIHSRHEPNSCSAIPQSGPRQPGLCLPTTSARWNLNRLVNMPPTSPDPLLHDKRTYGDIHTP